MTTTARERSRPVVRTSASRVTLILRRRSIFPSHAGTVRVLAQSVDSLAACRQPVAAGVRPERASTLEESRHNLLLHMRKNYAIVLPVCFRSPHADSLQSETPGLSQVGEEAVLPGEGWREVAVSGVLRSL